MVAGGGVGDAPPELDALHLLGPVAGVEDLDGLVHADALVRRQGAARLRLQLKFVALDFALSTCIFDATKGGGSMYGRNEKGGKKGMYLGHG